MYVAVSGKVAQLLAAMLF